MLGLLLAGACARRPVLEPLLEPLVSGVTVRLQAVSAPGQRVIWASGLGATFVRSVDGGQTWSSGVVADDTRLELRDLHAFDALNAVLLASGPGERSRIYATSDGGRTFALRHQATDPATFLDCLAFFDEQRGFVFGDSKDGAFEVLRTADGGRTWQPVEDLPPAAPAEGGFAASGGCAAALWDGRGYLVTGNAAPHARVLATTDFGMRFTAAPLPIAAGEGAGASALAASPNRADPLVAVGGNVTGDQRAPCRVARAERAGAAFSPAAEPPQSGALYGAAISLDGRLLVVVGPGGASRSRDGGASFVLLSADPYWSVAFASRRVAYLAGPEGRLARLRW